MVYQKRLISLYLLGDPMPRMFVQLFKQGKAILVSLKQNVFAPGNLYLYSMGKFVLCRIDRRELTFALDEGFDFDAPFLLCFMAKNQAFVGESGETRERNEVLEKFRTKERALCQQSSECTAERDIDRLTDRLCQKMFGFCAQTFYDQTKAQLSSILQKARRCDELEGRISGSRFCTLAEGIVVGVVFREGQPFLIAAGSSLLSGERQGRYQFFQTKDGEGYFMTFRRASDGDIYFVE